jgi:hypothetical protein
MTDTGPRRSSTINPAGPACPQPRFLPDGQEDPGRDFAAGTQPSAEPLADEDDVYLLGEMEPRQNNGQVSDGINYRGPHDPPHHAAAGGPPLWNPQRLRPDQFSESSVEASLQETFGCCEFRLPRDCGLWVNRIVLMILALWASAFVSFVVVIILVLTKVIR